MNVRFVRSVLAAALLCLGCGSAPVQAGSINGIQQVVVCDPTTNNGTNCIKPASDGSIAVTGSISASLAGFTPTAGATANVTDVVNTSQDVTLPAGADIVVTNKGTVDVFLRMQAGAGTALATDMPLKAGAAAGLHVTTQTHLSVIAPTGTGTGATAGQVNIQGGAGLVSGFGGGGTGGGGGAITAASGAFASGSIASGAVASGAVASGAFASGSVSDGAVVTLGAKTDAKSTATDSTSVSIMQVQKQQSASLQALAAAVGSAQPAACTGVIPISQTTSTDIKTMTLTGQICSIVLVAPDAEVVSLVQGTGTMCATGIAALMGGTTAANGMSLAANGGFSANSSAPWLVMTTTAQHLCLLQSGSGRIAGVITYVDK